MNNEQNHLSIAGERLLAPGDISESQLERVLSSLMGKGVDAADLYFQHSRHEHWLMEDGRVKSGSHSIEQGVGARVVSGDKTGFAYSDEIRMDALTQIASSARSIARQGQSGALALSPRGPGQLLYSPLDPVPSMSDEDKLKIMRQIESLARSLDPRITQVVVSLAASSDVILVANTDGTLAADVRPLVRLNVQVIAEQGERRESGTAGGGGRYDYRRLLEQGAGEHFAREAVRSALVNLEAEEAPAGTMAVVVGPGWPGVLLHEAVGHGLEGDFNRKGISAFSGRVGERVASELCTIVDDGTLPDRRGSLNIDDEGTPTQCTTLIENGVLKGYMQDRLNAKLSGNAVTGNGRRESFAHLPMPRMTNTYMLAGESDPQEIIASVKNGIYAVNFSGGQVDITSGKFVFSASEAYRIENGRVGAPVKGATLVGSGPEVLTRVSMVGNDLQLDEGTGVCGKEGQSVPVGVGQPTMRIDSLTVGGTSA